MTIAELAPLLAAVASLVSAVAASVAVIIGALNTRKINAVHVLTNSLAQRAEAGARAEGNLAGRVQQTAERKTEQTP